jgi:hypothetical protein
MALDFQPVYDALRLRLVAAWPGVDVHGAWEGDRASAIPYGQLEPPYSAIQAEESLGDGAALTMDIDEDTLPFDLYLVMEMDGDFTNLREQLNALRRDLYVNDGLFDGSGNFIGQVMTVGRPTWANSRPPNLDFAEKRLRRRAGRLTANVRVEDPA